MSARVVVAGAGGGIGRAIVAALADAGTTVAGVDLADADVVGTDLHVACDLRDPVACVEAVEEAADQLGGLDGLVHAAGITRDAVMWKLAPGDWDDVIAVNLTSAFHLGRAAIPHLRAAGSGAIVLVSSINAERGKFGTTAYSASKAGLNGLARALAREVGRFGIRVNCVAPGMIDTPMTAPLPEWVRVKAIEESCLGRIGRPEDVAGIVRFLLSDEARHITGQVVRVDGGQLA